MEPPVTPPCTYTATADPARAVTTIPPGAGRSDPAVSIEIIVPARNESRRLPEGLAALCQQAATLPLRTAILVVDSASTDGTGRIVRG